MHITKNEIPVKIDVPGAKARQLPDFGVTTAGAIGAEYFSLGAGTDIAPLLQGLDNDACHAPHWGYMISGEVVVSFSDGTTETCIEGDLYYWPPGHSVRVAQDSEVVMFSPQVEHGAVMDHMLTKLADATQ
ncbi:hypothetical protein [Nocardia sp. 348MFTsu5.1]|uniref:hypothetical protein n=1 Tax=Nocardia sp. 348MFTsu5.1 TaxID=1172185 RepID=UPI00039C486F|nr:hypothetical protein [Nocardia sp. 348MFTsu5.1]